MLTDMGFRDIKSILRKWRMTYEQHSNKNKISKFTIQQIAMIAVMTAVTCVLAPLSVPIGPVPISLTNLVIYFSLFILGTKKGTISYLIYLLIGLVGIPVFSGFTSGPGKLFGPTGGYLIGFIPLALIAGYFINHFPNKKALSFLGMILGTAVCYALGTAWLCHSGCTWVFRQHLWLVLFLSC